MEDMTELTWCKSSYSSNGGECVEIGTANGQAASIRDSKRPHDGHLVITAATFGGLLASVKRGDLDLPTRLTQKHCLSRHASRAAWTVSASLASSASTSGGKIA
jgi:hypothetical protein